MTRQGQAGVGRRDVLLGGAAAMLGAGAGATSAYAEPAAAAQSAGPPSSRPPNILVVFIDDLGYGDLSCYGSPMIHTPHLDRLARQGTRFTHGYAGHTVCTPSRAGLLTGRVPPRAGLPHVLFPEDTKGLSADERTIPEYLKQAGYSTTCIGKWHLGSQPEHNPTRHGFDHFFGALYSNDMTPFQLWRDEEMIEDPVDQSTLTRRYTEEAIAAIDRAGDDPFFIYLAETMPHLPLAVESRFDGQSEAGEYGDVVESLDHYLGVLFEALSSRGLDENTLVIVTSDNGPWFDGSSGPFRGRKIGTYEGGLRVPFIVRWPGVVPRRREHDFPVTVIDLLPTLCSYAGVEPDPDVTLDGTNVRAVLEGRRSVPRTPIYYFDDDDGSLSAVRDGRWKLHAQRQDETTRRLPELYDLERDSGESYNLASRNPDVVERLTAIIEEMEAEVAPA
ncbi:sulfatase [Georgenia deserti]|uniref:Sulfatase n=1 Tax=Georgenia deserti TaxID=2093781 RepID=A0ABW4LAC4_9MICO